MEVVRKRDDAENRQKRNNSTEKFNFSLHLSLSLRFPDLAVYSSLAQTRCYRPDQRHW